MLSALVNPKLSEPSKMRPGRRGGFQARVSRHLPLRQFKSSVADSKLFDAESDHRGSS